MKERRILVLITFLLLFSSCGPTLYVPNAVNVPLMGKKGDAKVAAGFHTRGDGAYDFQTAYAFTDQFALMANADFYRKRSDTVTNAFKSNRFGELALGWYTDFKQPQGSELDFRAEVYTGMGMGKSEDVTIYTGLFGKNPPTYVIYQGSYQRYFIQPSIGFKSEAVDLALSARAAYVNFPDWQQKEAGEATFISNGALYFATLEPTLTLAIGYNNVKLYSQTLFTRPFLNKEDYFEVTSGYPSIAFSLGMQYIFE